MLDRKNYKSGFNAGGTGKFQKCITFEKKIVQYINLAKTATSSQ